MFFVLFFLKPVPLVSVAIVIFTMLQVKKWAVIFTKTFYLKL